MEILIIGGVVVLLMVIISTQIKKGAERAYEREIVETEYFRLSKPEGFIYPLREDSEYAFEAYSKAYGEHDERNTWRAQIQLIVTDDLSFGAEYEKALSGADNLVFEKTTENADNGEKTVLIETEKNIDEIEFNTFYKIIESRKQNKTYFLKITVLKTFRKELGDKVEEFVNSFVLK